MLLVVVCVRLLLLLLIDTMLSLKKPLFVAFVALLLLPLFQVLFQMDLQWACQGQSDNAVSLLLHEPAAGVKNATRNKQKPHKPTAHKEQKPGTQSGQSHMSQSRPKATEAKENQKHR